MTSVPLVFALVAVVLVVAAVRDRRRHGSDSIRARIWLRTGVVFGVVAAVIVALNLARN